MLSSAALVFSCLVLNGLVLASPVAQSSGSGSSLTVPIRKSVSITSGHNVVDTGHARAQSFRGRAAGQQTSASSTAKRQSVGVKNEAITYIAQVSVGTSKQKFNLLVDSGSSNTWVGANTTNAYVPSSSSVWTDDIVIVEYGSGYFFGYEYYDTLTLSNALVITNQSLGGASFSQGFTTMDGILGIGPIALTDGTILGSTAPVFTVPTVSDNLYTQGKISNEVVGVAFAPTTGASNEPEGALVFGAQDSSRFVGQITYVPKETDYWGINQSISYKGVEIMATSTGVIDTGTTLLYLPTDTFNSYIASTGGVFDEATGLYEITEAQYNALEDLVFNIGGTELPLTPNAQIWPRSLNGNIGGAQGKIYLNAVSTEPVNGLNFINGYVFLERYYTVFDTTNNRVGFAATSFTNATSN
ncbi:hypothetical protein D9757_005902 [Collybiopsis confluens]|uniref:Peptidase A1 domain-containing protein n=1 Tax=Collybiopsis confluens TaxID=2823264 RepID=A0A8H5MA69_9AGAR|nr:hypothetical protein D9757_005902 [Collybiopsis confluens]